MGSPKPDAHRELTLPFLFIEFFFLIGLRARVELEQGKELPFQFY